MQKQRGNNSNNNNNNIYIEYDLFLDWAEGVALRALETRKLSFFFFLSFLWCLKSGNWVRVAAASCRKYPTTTTTTTMRSCCCCCCCCSNTFCGFGELWKYCHTWRMRNMRNFFPKRRSCRPKGQAATSTSTSIIQRQQHWETPPPPSQQSSGGVVSPSLHPPLWPRQRVRGN